MTKSNEITIKVLAPEESAKLGLAQLRSDAVPKPTNFFVGEMRVLKKPEPIKRTKKK